MSSEMTQRETSLGDRGRPETVQQERWLKPACDVYENEGEWLITADVPGAKRDALHLHLDKNELTIEARRAEWFGEQADCAGYRRAFTLPVGIDGDKVKAVLSSGVVSIHLPKSDAIRPRRIEVRAG